MSISKNLHIKTIFLFTVYFIGLFRLIAYLVTPIALVKAGISLLHLITASMDMGGVDAAERAHKAD